MYTYTDMFIYMCICVFGTLWPLTATATQHYELSEGSTGGSVHSAVVPGSGSHRQRYKGHVEEAATG